MSICRKSRMRSFGNSELLFAPQLQEKRRHFREYGFSSMNFGVATWTECDHQVQEGSSGLAMVDSDRPLIPARSSAHPAAVAIALQNHFSQAAEVFFILPAKGIAGGAHPIREDPLSSTPAVHEALCPFFHAR